MRSIEREEPLTSTQRAVLMGNTTVAIRNGFMAHYAADLQRLIVSKNHVQQLITDDKPGNAALRWRALGIINRNNHVMHMAIGAEGPIAYSVQLPFVDEPQLRIGIWASRVDMLTGSEAAGSEDLVGECYETQPRSVLGYATDFVPGDLLVAIRGYKAQQATGLDYIRPPEYGDIPYRSFDEVSHLLDIADN